MTDLSGENDFAGFLVEYGKAGGPRSWIDLQAQIRQRGILDFFLENERKRKPPQHGGLSSSEEYLRHSRSCRRERFPVCIDDRYFHDATLFWVRPDSSGNVFLDNDLLRFICRRHCRMRSIVLINHRPQSSGLESIPKCLLLYSQRSWFISLLRITESG